VLWCVTGSGTWIKDLWRALKRLRRAGLVVDVCMSRAGEEVARIYGALPELAMVANELFLDRLASGGRLAGRVASGRYCAVVIAPATSNTVAKIVAGIADTLPTTVASQCVKSGVPLIVAPSDYGERALSTAPCTVDPRRCVGCGVCASSCPVNAISIVEGVARIDYSRCVGTGICAAICPRSAIECWRTIVVEVPRAVLELVARLRDMGVTIVESLDEAVERVLEVCLGEAHPEPP